jgi:indole-3-glycerol phosphate synthase
VGQLILLPYFPATKIPKIIVLFIYPQSAIEAAKKANGAEVALRMKCLQKKLGRLKAATYHLGMTVKCHQEAHQESYLEAI